MKEIKILKLATNEIISLPIKLFEDIKKDKYRSKKFKFLSEDELKELENIKEDKKEDEDLEIVTYDEIIDKNEILNENNISDYEDTEDLIEDEKKDVKKSNKKLKSK